MVEGGGMDLYGLLLLRERRQVLAARIVDVEHIRRQTGAEDRLASQIGRQRDHRGPICVQRTAWHHR